MIAGVRQSFAAHIRELRQRLLWSASLLMIGGLAGYTWHRPIIRLLQQPLGQPLFYNSPAGGFEFSMKISLLVGLVLALPALVYNLVRFIEPALKNRLRTPQLVTLVFLSFGLALSGMAFAFYIVLPLSLHFFSGFASDQIKSLISAHDYLSFVLACLATFVIMFQIPLVLLFIDRLTPLSPRRLQHYRRYVIVGSLVIALALPFTYDPVTQFVIAIPMVVLYELSIGLVWLAHRRRAHRTIPTAMSNAVLPDGLPISGPEKSSPKSTSRQIVHQIASPHFQSTRLLDLRHCHVAAVESLASLQARSTPPVPTHNIIDLRQAP